MNLATAALGLLVAGLLLLLALGVRAHGDAAWIMADPATRWCCGPQDCFELQTVASTAAGWEFASPVNGEKTVVTYRFPNRYPSINEHFWVCMNGSGGVRCFFVSPEGV